LDEWHMETVF